MNVVVSAIVDPWVTTLSFVVALAMRIQGQKLQILCRNQARFVGTLALAIAVTNLGARSLDAQLTVWRENPLLAGQLPREPRVLAPKFPQSKR